MTLEKLYRKDSLTNIRTYFFKWSFLYSTLYVIWMKFTFLWKCEMLLSSYPHLRLFAFDRDFAQCNYTRWINRDAFPSFLPSFLGLNTCELGHSIHMEIRSLASDKTLKRWNLYLFSSFFILFTLLLTLSNFDFSLSFFQSFSLSLSVYFSVSLSHFFLSLFQSLSLF